jgi:hypothetical protein
MMKMMILAGRKPGMTVDAFRRHLCEVHAPLVRSVPEVAAGIRRYHYNLPLPATPDDAFGHRIDARLDVVTQGWFDSREAQLRNMAEPAYLAIVRPDEGRFANEAEAVMHYTWEKVIDDGPITARKLFCFRRRVAGLSREDFQAAWRDGLPRALAAGGGCGGVVSRYVQNHVMAEADHPDGGDGKFYDVIDEFFLHDGAAPATLRSDAALRDTVRASPAQSSVRRRRATCCMHAVRSASRGAGASTAPGPVIAAAMPAPST